MKPTVTVPSGTVEATHRHLNYGPCIIVQGGWISPYVGIRTNTGTAIVPRDTLKELPKETT